MESESQLISDEEEIVENGLSSVISQIDSGKVWEVVFGFAWRFMVALAIVIIGWQIIRLIRNFAKKAMERGNISSSTSKLVLNLMNAIMYILLAFIAAEQLGIPSATIIALIGSVGIAIGLSLQGSLSNVAGGLLILLMRPFSIGDYIQVCEVEGTVQNIGMVYTTILTPDNCKITIPNSTISNSTITNVTSEGKRRVEVIVPISYQDDIDKAREVMIDAFKGCDKILQDNEIYAFVSEFDGSSVKMAGRGWAESTDYWAALWDVQEKVKVSFDAAGLEIPFEQVAVHLRDAAKDETTKDS